MSRILQPIIILSLLGDSWNYMPPILVPSSAKPISTWILVIAKLSGRKVFILRCFFMILFIPGRNYLFKVGNWRAKIRCASTSKLRMKILERCQWRHSSVFVVNCEHISSFVLIVEFEQANLCWVHIEKTRLGISFVML